VESADEAQYAVSCYGSVADEVHTLFSCYRIGEKCS